jgi:acyl carrier protein
VEVEQNGSRDKRLVAYLAGEPESVPTHSELYLSLKKRLPTYMIPSAFVVLDDIPLTTSGKLDRKALPSTSLHLAPSEESYVAPSTPLEEALAEIWSELLNVERVGVHDNFFELGGHSLLATQVISRMREAFQVDIPLRSLFETPTVFHLAAEMERERAKQNTNDDQPKIRSVRRGRRTMEHLLSQLEQLTEQEASRIAAERRALSNSGIANE